MFYDIEHFPVLQQLRANVDRIAEELYRADSDPVVADFLSETPQVPYYRHVEYWTRDVGIHPEQIGDTPAYGGSIALPLYKRNFPVKDYNPEAAFPFLFPLQLQVPELNFSAFFRLPPESGTREHTHTSRNLIFHLCLSDADGISTLTCAGEQRALGRKGDYVIFDYSKPHSSFNKGRKDRINLVCDFVPPPGL